MNGEMNKKLFYILVFASMIANLFGVMLNAFLHGNTLPTQICTVCGGTTLLIGIVGIITEKKKYATAGILITVMWIEFPLLYGIYGNIILIYFVLSILGCLIFIPWIYREVFTTLTIMWDIVVILLFSKGDLSFEAENEYSTLAFTICSYLIVSLAVFTILDIVICLNEGQKKKLTEMNVQLSFAATHDALTRLYNRMYLMTELEERVHKSSADFIIVILDIDNFKSINDTYGHIFGDEVLVGLAHILEAEIAGQGFAARYGGEEFVIVFNHHNQQEALFILTRIQEKFKKLFLNEKQLIITFSGGMEVYSTERKIDEVMKGADNKLYEAKKNGKNQVICGR